MNTRELGKLGEKLACEYLVGKGFNILGKNSWISFGEIDIIARKKQSLFARFFGKADKTLHFVEVKTLLQSFHPEPVEGYFPEEHVNFAKKQKLRRLAQIWLNKNGYPPDYPHQIDIIGILVNQATNNAKLHYFPNAFGE